MTDVVRSNQPPIENDNSAVFILQRASGEIEIRGASSERVWMKMQQYPDCKFGEIEQMNEALFACKGMRAA